MSFLRCRYCFARKSFTYGRHVCNNIPFALMHFIVFTINVLVDLILFLPTDCQFKQREKKSGTSWDSTAADAVYITHRDLRDVVASFRRMKWAKSLPSSYVSDHMAWTNHATIDFSYDRILHDELCCLQELRARCVLTSLYFSIYF
jgi:hypothetical protein